MTQTLAPNPAAESLRQYVTRLMTEMLTNQGFVVTDGAEDMGRVLAGVVYEMAEEQKPEIVARPSSLTVVMAVAGEQLQRYIDNMAREMIEQAQAALVKEFERRAAGGSAEE